MKPPRHLFTALLMGVLLSACTTASRETPARPAVKTNTSIPPSPSVAAAATEAFKAPSTVTAPATTDAAGLTARLSGASEVPPTPSTAKGDLQATLDKHSRVLTWTLALSGLSGPPTGAHFHGPAAPGENADPAAPITVTGQPTDNGVITLTAAQMDALLAERWYINVKTAAHPDGEIRGQVIVAQR
jgi:CHRD domain